ncbi:hypothetical protein R3P38DRAFT_3053720 [Favolaschia claudopus]|uniref:Uncharacterized protein n=1 Tax=Favolaschia claudopus TaxID=2862362 RepID=A0AAW0A436_9AGAR
MDQQYTVPPPRYTPAQQQPQYIFPSHDPLSASSSSPSLPAMQPASPTWSELELKTLGHRIAPSHLRQHSPSSPSLLVQHLPHDSLSVNNNLSLPVTASDSFIPDDDPDSPVEVQATTFRQPTAAFFSSRRRAPAPTPAPTPGPASQPPDDTIPDAIEFEVMVWLPAPPEKSAGARLKQKRLPNLNNRLFGPITAHTDMDYDDFLEVLAEKLSATPNFLVLSSMEPGKGVSATYIIPPATQATPTATSSRYTGAAEGADEPELSDGRRPPRRKRFDAVAISPHKISLDLGTKLHEVHGLACGILSSIFARFIHLLRIICLHSSRATSSRSLAARRRTL